MNRVHVGLITKTAGIRRRFLLNQAYTPMTKWIPWFVLFVGSLPIARGQTPSTVDSVQNEHLIYPIPIAYWSPETKLAGGLTVYYTRRSFDSDHLRRTNTFGVSGIYTQKKQVIVAASFDRYWRDETYRLSGSVSYSKYPDFFYGIGPASSIKDEEPYTSQIVSVFVNGQKRVRPSWYLGVIVDWDHSRIVEAEDGGLLDRRAVTGSGRGTASGLGVTLLWDTRSSNIFPTDGHYRAVHSSLFSPLTLSDYTYLSAVVDLRQYTSVFGNHVVAAQLYAKIIHGDPPFYKMAMMGGSRLMRGYYPGRYRDRNLVALQAEYRMPLFWRLGLVSFLGFGDVAHRVTEFRWSHLKYSTGFGLRFVLSKKDHTNIRLDLAYGRNSAYPAISIGEAF